MLTPLFLACALGLAAASPAHVSKAVPPVAAPQASVSRATPAAAPSYDSDVPPPTRYDLEHAHDAFPSESRTLVGQLIRTIIALATVIGLIYLLVKLVLPRLMPGVLRPTEQQLRVVERNQLDAKHGLFLVDIGDGRRLLIGTSEHNVQLLATLPTLTTPKISFDAALEAHAVAHANAESRDAQKN